MKITSKQIISIGVILVFGGIFLLCNNYFQAKKAKVYDTITLAISELPTYIDEVEEEIEDYEEETINDNTNTEQDENTDNSKSNEIITPEEYYIGKLEIPTINFSRGFASLKSKYNNVNKNIAVINTSTYPDTENGNLILAGHSGSSWNSFFNDLSKLKKGNIAYIYYNNIKYTYKLSDIYDEDKTGYLTVKRDTNKTTLTLVTCSKRKKNKQNVYIFYLTNQEQY